MIESIFAWVKALFPSFLMALTDQLGCVFFLNSQAVPEGSSLHRWQGRLFWLFSVFCAVPLQRGAFLMWGTYEAIAAKMIFFFVFIFLWTRKNILICLYDMMVYFLISDCLRTLSGFLSQNLLHYDIFLSDTLSELIAANLAEATVLFLTVWLIRLVMERAGRPVLRRAHIPVLAVSLLPYLFIRGITIWLPISNEDLTAETPVMMLITLLVGLLLLIGNVTAVSSERHTAELRQLEQMLSAQHTQFTQSKEMTDRINHSYHDLKNTLLYLQSCTDQTVIREELEQMWQQIQPYETELNTGNQAADVILSQKLSLCQENHIRCVPYIDGHLLDFIEPLDICTILGNALDNAIEACMKIPDEKKRQIRIRAILKNQMLSLHMENSCDTLPKEQDGQLLTDKPDAAVHGFGIRSMRHTVEKYGGQLSYRTAEGQFMLDILLPYPSEGAAAV